MTHTLKLSIKIILAFLIFGTSMAGEMGSPRGLSLERDFRKVKNTTCDKIDRKIPTESPRAKENKIKKTKGETKDKLNRNDLTPPRLKENYPRMF